MTDLLSVLDAIKRPRLLINAARIGMPEYRREAHLPRHLGDAQLPRSSVALERLIEIESDLNDRRRGRTAGYSAARHVDVLIAMMGEARILRAADRPFS
ncbi:MAG: DUF6477 family protein [Pseudomonadota bacterium]